MEVLIESINHALCAIALDSGHSLSGVEIDPEFEQVRHGTIYIGRIDRIDATQNCAYVDIGHNIQARLNAADARNLGKKTDQALSKWLNAGDLILVQAQDGLISPHDNSDPDMYEDKLVRLTMDITLHGRFTLYAPYQTENTISKRIKDKKLRTQLETMLISEDMHGVILRAATAHIQNDMIIREYRLLEQIWKAVLENLPTENKAMPILAGPDSVMRMLSNQAMNTIERIEICGESYFEHTQHWCMQFAPDLVSKLILSDIDEHSVSEDGLLEHRGVLTPIEDLYRPYAVLSNGCSIIIEHTAALTAIDVNRGGANGRILDINKVCAHDIMQQIKLRNLSGIIIVDFLKLTKESERKEFTDYMKELALNDHYTTQVHGLTKLGLMEITRAKRTPPLAEKLASLIHN